MKARLVEFGKKLLSIKILVILPLATVLVCRETISDLVWFAVVALVLGAREALKIIQPK